MCLQNSPLQIWHVHTFDVKVQRTLAKDVTASVYLNGKNPHSHLSLHLPKDFGPQASSPFKTTSESTPSEKNSFSKGYCTVKQLKMTLPQRDHDLH